MPVIQPVMVRCTQCARWASVRCAEEVATATCGACGSPVAAVDMAEHVQTLPRSANDPADEARLAAQKARDAAAKEPSK